MWFCHDFRRSAQSIQRGGIRASNCSARNSVSTVRPNIIALPTQLAAYQSDAGQLGFALHNLAAHRVTQVLYRTEAFVTHADSVSNGDIHKKVNKEAHLGCCEAPPWNGCRAQAQLAEEGHYRGIVRNMFRGRKARDDVAASGV